MTTIRSIGLCVAVGAAASIASGEIAYNNFDVDHDGFDYNWGTGWTVAGDDNPVQYGVEQAQAFTATATGELSDIYVPIWYASVTSEPDSVTVHIATYNGPTAPTPGDILESWTVTDLPDWFSWADPHHLESTGGVQIEAGEKYWIWMEPASAETWAGWGMVTDPTYTHEHTLRREDQDWLPVSNSTAGALRVDVVPAPGGALAMAMGFGLTAKRRRRA